MQNILLSLTCKKVMKKGETTKYPNPSLILTMDSVEIQYINESNPQLAS